MTVQSSKVAVRLTERKLTSKLRSLRTAKSEVATARIYSDHVELRSGALSAPRYQFRPGLRDDEMSCSFANMLPLV